MGMYVASYECLGNCASSKSVVELETTLEFSSSQPVGRIPDAEPAPVQTMSVDR